MSKFDYDGFHGGYDSLAVSKEKHTREEAITIAARELECIRDCITCDKTCYLAVGEGFVVWRAGVNEDLEPSVGWWLEYTPRKRSCPCWVFHLSNDTNEFFSDDYEYLNMKDLTT